MENGNLPQAETFKDEHGHWWFSPKYLEEMMRRKYQEGYNDGRKDIIHVAEITVVNQIEATLP